MHPSHMFLMCACAWLCPSRLTADREISRDQGYRGPEKQIIPEAKSFSRTTSALTPPQSASVAPSPSPLPSPSPTPNYGPKAVPSSNPDSTRRALLSLAHGLGSTYASRPRPTPLPRQPPSHIPPTPCDNLRRSRLNRGTKYAVTRYAVRGIRGVALAYCNANASYLDQGISRSERYDDPSRSEPPGARGSAPPHSSGWVSSTRSETRVGS